MFTGLIQDVGEVEVLRPVGQFATLMLKTRLADATLAIGDSLAVNGACLTVVKNSHGRVTLEAVAETLRCTNLGSLRSGAKVNLERPLRVGDRLDGHYVLGHVDTVVEVKQIAEVGPSWVMALGFDSEWSRYVVEKGSVALDGVSLTVASLTDGGFTVSLVPHTLESCTLRQKKHGDRLNLETDILAKHVERFLGKSAINPSRGGVKKESLKEYGFL